MGGGRGGIRMNHGTLSIGYTLTLLQHNRGSVSGTSIYSPAATTSGWRQTTDTAASTKTTSFREPAQSLSPGTTKTSTSDKVRFRLSRTTLPGQSFFVLESKSASPGAKKSVSPRRENFDHGGGSASSTQATWVLNAGDMATQDEDGKSPNTTFYRKSSSANTTSTSFYGKNAPPSSPPAHPQPGRSASPTDVDDKRFYTLPPPLYTETPTSPWVAMAPVRADAGRRTTTLSAKRMEDIRHLEVKNLETKKKQVFRKKPQKSGVFTQRGVVSPRHQLFIDRKTGLVLNPNSPSTKRRIAEELVLGGADLREVKTTVKNKEGRKMELRAAGVPQNVGGAGGGCVQVLDAPGILLAPYGMFTPYRLLTPAGPDGSRGIGHKDSDSVDSEPVYGLDGRELAHSEEESHHRVFDHSHSRGGRDFEAGTMLDGLGLGGGARTAGGGTWGRGLEGRSRQRRHALGAADEDARGAQSSRKTRSEAEFASVWARNAAGVLQNPASERLTRLCGTVCKHFDEFVRCVDAIHRYAVTK